MDINRKLVYDFLTMPYSQRMRIMTDLGVIRKEEYELSDFEMFKNCIIRLREQDRIQELRDAVYPASEG